MRVTIVGAGIGGLTLALELHAAGVDCVVYEAVSNIAPIGVGINLLPHAVRVLSDLGLEDALAAVAVATQESVFFNRFGQLIYSEPAGRYAGYAYPQFSIHRGDLQSVLLTAVVNRLGADAVRLGHHCTGFTQDTDKVTAQFEGPNGEELRSISSDVLVGCDGIHSRIRKQMHPDEGDPRYSGVNMWRGVAVHPPILSGASMIRAGWLAQGKIVIYPVRDNVDAQGNQLINWVAEIETPEHTTRDWKRRGRLEDFLPQFEGWTFDWLNVPELIRASDPVLEYPMVDQDPLDWWTEGRVTLLGDAAHPMVPRGSNGAGQAIVDARVLHVELAHAATATEALKNYEARRLPTTRDVVLMNRQQPPDAILREVWERTGDTPFDDINSVISREELRAISEAYKQTAGYSATDPTLIGGSK